MKKIIIFLTLFVFGIAFLTLYFWSGIYLSKSKNFSETKIIQIKKGDTLEEIAQKLEREGLIKKAHFFTLYNFISCNTPRLKAGYYLFSPSMTIPEIVAKIVRGEVIKDKITIIEGWNTKEVANHFETKNICQKEDFFRIISKDFSSEFEFLRDKPKNQNLEGYLFPDTYEIIYGEEPENLIKRILKNFDKKITQEMRKEIKNQRKTIFEIVTMASLLEKEVKTIEEKKIVSGILWKRLENKIPLQVDATINYITGKRTTKISIEETKIDNPYNTYLYLGLPPGPICNPGLDSLTAAIHPQESDYWYYLTAPEGTTIFSKTYQEHLIAKAKYLK